MAKHNDLEHKALQHIMKTGDKGILQSELWQELGASSREGSRIALKLESKGLIKREKELYQGRWTYRLFPRRKPASINSIIDCPCLTCSQSIKCGAGSAISPNTCEKLTEWLQNMSQKSSNSLGDS
jgi:predicted transcriptional regulator